jgi:ATP-dependent RNA circularization protein (DNA/RNA ligase family)
MKQKLNEFPYKKLQHSDALNYKFSLNEGAEIVIYEKLDGANASFQLVDNAIIAYSRRTELDETNGLNGFYEWTQSQLDASKIPTGLRIFGEWMTPHTVKYIEDVQKKFYLFDVLHMETQEYLHYDQVEELAKQLNLEMAPIFYRGPHIGAAHVDSFKGKSHFADNGEGLVVLLVEQNEKVKMVTKEFKETHRPSKASNTTDKMNAKELVLHEINRYMNELMTPARIEKMIHKKMDEGQLNNEIKGKQVSEVFGEVALAIIEDAFEEEITYIEENFTKLIAETNWKQSVKAKSLGKVISVARKYISIT